MKRTCSFFFLVLMLASNKLKSQDVKVNGTALEVLLCKTWAMDYALLGDKKEYAPAEEKKTTIQFLKNKTLVYSTGRKGDSFSGTWRYNALKKSVEIILHGKIGFIVTAITDAELTMMFPSNISGNNTKEMKDVKVVYTVKN
jgi:hypothetical protein